MKAPLTTPDGRGAPRVYAIMEGGRYYLILGGQDIPEEAVIVGYSTGKIWDSILIKHGLDPWSRQDDWRDSLVYIRGAS